MYNSTILSFFSCNGGGGNGGGEGAGAEDDAPRLTSIDPTINAVSIFLGSGITATFDQRMKAASETSFSVIDIRNPTVTSVKPSLRSRTGKNEDRRLVANIIAKVKIRIIKISPVSRNLDFD